jgi:hypothetical protein
MADQQLEKMYKIIETARKKSSRPKTISAQELLPAEVQNAKQLPLWPNFVRALPNPLARSALFSISHNSASRAYLKEQKIASINGVSIFYTGEELRQRDEDVFLQLLHFARSTPLGEWVDFTAYGLVKALGWSINSRSYNDLRSILDRLSATNIIVSFGESGQEGYSGSLVRKFMWRTPEGQKLSQWRVYFEPEIIALFAPASYTHIYWELRLSLPPLAKWLHSFYSTHESPFDYKVKTLHELCGSSSKLHHYREMLADALELLKSKQFLIEGAISRETDLVHVVRAKNPMVLI